MFTVVLFGLGAAFAWGSGDFLGGWNARRLPSTTVAFWAQSTSLLILFALVIAVRPGWDGAAFGWGLAAGLFTGFGGAVLYRGLATGNAAVVAPLSALGAVVPVVASVVQGDARAAWPGTGSCSRWRSRVRLDPRRRRELPQHHHLGRSRWAGGRAWVRLLLRSINEGRVRRPELVVLHGGRLGRQCDRLEGSVGGIPTLTVLPNLVAWGSTTFATGRSRWTLAGTSGRGGARLALSVGRWTGPRVLE